MIEYLHIVNFRNIVDMIIEPSQDVNLFEGNNGEGKSSIQYAIEYLLTDNLNEKISEYVRWGCEKFILEMKFSFNENKFYIKVEGDKSAKKELIINDDKENIYKNSQATKKLSELIDPTIIRYSSISEQGKTAQILFDLPTNRLKKLKEILGIDKLADLSDEMKNEIQEKEQEIKEYNKECKLLEERQYNYLDVPEVIDIEQIKNKFELLEKDKQIYESQSKLHEKYLNEKQNYDKAYNIISDNQEFILKYYSSIDNLNKSQIEYNHIESEEKLRELHSKYEKEKIDQEYKVDNYKKTQKRIKELNILIEQQKQELDKLQLRRLSNCKYSENDLKDIEKAIFDNQILLDTSIKELKLIEQGKCPTCGKDYICNKDEITTYIDFLKKSIKDETNLLSQIKTEISDYNKAINEQEIIKVKRQSIQTIIDNYCKELESLNDLDFDEEYINNLCDYNSLLQGIKDKLENRRQVQLHNIKISDEIKELENKIKVCQSLIDQYKDIKMPEQIEEPELFNFVDYEDCKKEIFIHEQKIKERDRAIEYNLKVNKEKQDNENKIKIIKSNIDSVSFQISVLKESRQVLDKDFTAYLIDKGAEYIKERMNDFFQRVYPKYIITFKQDKNSIDFYYGDEVNVAPCSMASGMEKACLAISFRIALCSLNNFNLMILDEIDSDFSEENSLRLYSTLFEFMNEYQIFCITHCDATKEFIMQQRNSKSFKVEKGMLIN